MAVPDRTDLLVTVDLRRTPLQGAVTDAGGSRQPFTGWLQFVAAVEAAIANAHMPLPQPAEREDPT